MVPGGDATTVEAGAHVPEGRPTRAADGPDVCGPECRCRSGPLDAGLEQTQAATGQEAGPIYLDHAATTPVRPEVIEAMLPYFAGVFGNASSLHLYGQKARDALEDARDVVADCIGARSKEICFTSGGTESDNLAVVGAARAAADKRRHLVTTRIEHHAVLNTCKHLESEGHQVTYLPVDRSGVVCLDALEQALRRDTVLVSVMLANNETGTRQPVADVAEITRRHGVPLHTDAVQAIGKIPVDVNELGVDMLSISAHKIDGPNGVGALYVRSGTRIAPIVHGGRQEGRRRAGTENVAGIVGLATAMRLAQDEMPRESTRLAALRDRLERGVRHTLPQVRLNGHPTHRLPSILNLGFPGVEAESLLLTLDLSGVAVSVGSACQSGSTMPSHVLQAMGVDPVVARGSVRFSLGRTNTDAEIDRVVVLLADIVERLRSLSPTYAASVGR